MCLAELHERSKKNGLMRDKSRALIQSARFVSFRCKLTTERRSSLEFVLISRNYTMTPFSLERTIQRINGLLCSLRDHQSCFVSWLGEEADISYLASSRNFWRDIYKQRSSLYCCISCPHKRVTKGVKIQQRFDESQHRGENRFI